MPRERTEKNRYAIAGAPAGGLAAGFATASAWQVGRGSEVKVSAYSEISEPSEAAAGAGAGAGALFTSGPASQWRLWEIRRPTAGPSHLDGLGRLH